jgi:hypothetical protein
MQMKLSLYSRRRKSFSRQYQHVFEALRDLPPNTVVDGKIVALAGAGRPNFNFLQHSRSKAKRICYFVFDLPIYDNRNLTHCPRMLCVRQRGGPCGRCGRFPDPFDAFPSNLVFRRRRPQRGSAGRLVRDHYGTWSRKPSRAPIAAPARLKIGNNRIRLGRKQPFCSPISLQLREPVARNLHSREEGDQRPPLREQIKLFIYRPDCRKRTWHYWPRGQCCWI